MPIYDDLLNFAPPRGFNQFRIPTIEEQLAAAMRSTPRATPVLTPEEETGILGRMMSGLQYFGETLDKPGRALRGTVSGLAGGEWGGGLLNLIPFSDTLGITNPQESVGGRDVLVNLGIAPENQSGFSPLANPQDAAWDAASFATEVLLDPLILAGGPMASLTKAGKAVSAANKFKNWDEAIEQVGKVAAGTAEKGRVMGASPGAMIDEIRAGERGIASIGLPFSQNRYVIGAGSEKAAKAMEMLYYGKLSPIRPFRGLLSKIVGGVPEGLAQVSRDHTYARLQDVHAAWRDTTPLVIESSNRLGKLVGEISASMEKAGNKFGFRDFDELSRYIVDMQNVGGKNLQASLDTVKRAIAEHASVPLPEDQLDELAHGVYDLADGMFRFKDKVAERYRDLGGNLAYLDDDFSKHFPRRFAKSEYAKLWESVQPMRMMGDKVPYSSPRNDALRHLPGGSYTVHRMTTDDMLTATAKLGKDDEVLRADLQFTLKTLDDTFDVMSPEDFGKMSTVDLQKHYAYLTHVEPEVKRLMEMGSLGIDDAETYRRWFLDGLEEGENFMGRDIAEKAPAQGKVLVDFLRRLPEHILTDPKGRGLFNKTMAEDWSDYVEYLTVASSNLSTMRHILHGTARIDDPDYGISLGEAWGRAAAEKGSPLQSDRGVHTFVRDYLGEVWQNSPDAAKKANLPQVGDLYDYDAIMESLNKSMSSNPQLFEQVMGMAQPGDMGKIVNKIQSVWAETPQLAHRLGLPKAERLINADTLSSAAAAIRVHQDAPKMMMNFARLISPEVQSGLFGAFKATTTLWKTYVTVPAPAFHSRNMFDSFTRSVLRAGADTYNLGTYLKHYGKTIKEVLGGKPLDDVEHGAEYLAHSSKSYLSGYLGDEAAEAISATGKREPITSAAQAFQPFKALKDAAGRGVKGEGWGDFLQQINPARVRGFKKLGLDEQQNVIAEAGSRVHELIEYVNRKATYSSLRESGKDPSAAKWLTDQIHYDYKPRAGGALPDNFGDRIARNVIPFWGFVSSNIPYQLGQLLNRPGGGHAQLLRFMNVLQKDSEGYVPQWLREHSAVRLGGTDKEAVYMRRIGLSNEDVFSMLRFEGGMPDIRRAATRMLAQTNPLISGTLKHLTGRDLYTDRPIKEMRSPTEDWTGYRSNLVDTLLMASPLSRGVSTADTLSDPRKSPLQKAVDLATGVKLAVYDVEGQKYSDIARQIEKMLEDDPRARWMKIPYQTKGEEVETDPATQNLIREHRVAGEQRKKYWEKRNREKEKEKRGR